MTKFEDEDDDFSMSSQKGKEKGHKGKEADSKKSAPAVENEEELDCGWGDTELMKAKNPLPRIYPQKDGEAVRFALIQGVQPKRALTHYIEKKGTFRCLSTGEEPGLCCEKLKENPTLSIVALAIQYTNCSPKTGRYEGPYKSQETEYTIGYVKLSRTNYTQICKLVEDPEEEEDNTAERQPETVFDFDMVMSHNEQTGIGYSITRASRSPRWKKDEAVMAGVAEAVEKFKDGKLLTQRLGRKQTKAEWVAMFSDAGQEDDGEL